MGMQTPISNVTLSESSPDTPKRTSRAFWREYVRPKKIRHQRQASPLHPIWRDDAALSRVAGDWTVIVEENNRIVHDHREPFWTNWTYSLFLQRYLTRKWHNRLYCITQLDSRLERFAPVYDELACPELLESREVHYRMWHSAGNTSSSLHFDTHDVLLTQMDGEKEVWLWHPFNASRTYMDYHTRYGLSPINPDHVDLREFPEWANAHAERVHLMPGDRLFIPALWWHQIRSGVGRNLMLTTEFEYMNGMPWVRDHNSSAETLTDTCIRQMRETRPYDLTCSRGAVRHRNAFHRR